MNIILDNYTPLISYLSPASIPQIVAHIQDYLLKHPILSVETIAEIIVQSLQEHPELINGEAIPISADSAQSIKAYIDALPFLDTYTKAEINALLLGKQDTLTFDQAPTPGSSNPVTSSGIIAALSALQTALETQISLKADSASTYTKNQVDTLLEDKADADDVYSKNTMDAKLLEINMNIDNLDDELSDQSQQITNVENGIAIIVNGDSAAQTVYQGQYAYLTNNTNGLDDGLYTALQTFPTGGQTPATSAYFSKVNGGALNNISANVTQRVKALSKGRHRMTLSGFGLTYASGTKATQTTVAEFVADDVTNVVLEDILNVLVRLSTGEVLNISTAELQIFNNSLIWDVTLPSTVANNAFCYIGGVAEFVLS